LYWLGKGFGKREKTFTLRSRVGDVNLMMQPTLHYCILMQMGKVIKQNNTLADKKCRHNLSQYNIHLLEGLMIVYNKCDLPRETVYAFPKLERRG